ncbi:hypothetical protein ABPG74_016345 [Tetrahymena malaccensis]
MKTNEPFLQDQQLFSSILRKKSQKELQCQYDDSQASPKSMKNKQQRQKALFLLSNFSMLKNKPKCVNSSFFEDKLSKTSQPLLLEKKISISQHNKVSPNYSLLRQIVQPQKQQYGDKLQQRISAIQDQYFQYRPNQQLKQVSNCSLNNIENSPLIQSSKCSLKNIEILKKCETERYQSLKQREFARYQEKQELSLKLEPNELLKQQNFTQVSDQSLNTNNCEIVQKKGQQIKQLQLLDTFQVKSKKTQQPFFRFQDVNMNVSQNNNFISNSKYLAKGMTQLSQNDLDNKLNINLNSESSLIGKENFNSTKQIIIQNQNKNQLENNILIKQRSLTKQEYGSNKLKQKMDLSFENQKEQNTLINNRTKLLNLQKFEKQNLFFQIFQNNQKKQTTSPNNKINIQSSNNTSDIAIPQIDDLNQPLAAQKITQQRGINSLNRISNTNLANQQGLSEEKKIINEEQRFKIQISIFPVDLNDFKFLKELGHGSYAIVRSAVHKKTNFVVAIKSYDKSKLLDPQKKQNLDREIKILQNLNHNYIIKLYKVIENSQSMNLVMEYSSSIPLRKENKQLYKNILKCQPEYPMFISPSAQNLLQSILKEDPDQRKQLEDILQDEWF